MMQAAKPRPALTFTYQDPPERPRPYYRLVLTFDPANDYGSNSVCAGIPPRFKQGRPGFFYVFAVYCRNDQVLSETTAWTPATGPTIRASPSCSASCSRSSGAIRPPCARRSAAATGVSSLRHPERSRPLGCAQGRR